MWDRVETTGPITATAVEQREQDGWELIHVVGPFHTANPTPGKLGLFYWYFKKTS